MKLQTVPGLEVEEAASDPAVDFPDRVDTKLDMSPDDGGSGSTKLILTSETGQQQTVPDIKPSVTVSMVTSGGLTVSEQQVVPLPVEAKASYADESSRESMDLAVESTDSTRNNCLSVVTDAMISEEAELRKASLAEEAETRRLNLEKMRSLAQEDCYRRLKFLLEKSQRYTSYVHERMQAQREHIEQLERQLDEKRRARAEAEAERKKNMQPPKPETLEAKVVRRSRRNLNTDSSQGSETATLASPVAVSNVGPRQVLGTSENQENVKGKTDENDNIVVGNKSDDDSADVINTGCYAVGTKLKVKYGPPENFKIYVAKVLKINAQNEPKMYFVHYDGWKDRYNEWISNDSVVGVADDVPGRGKRKSLATVAAQNCADTDVEKQKLTSGQPATEPKKRGRKRKIDEYMVAETDTLAKKAKIEDNSSAAESQSQSQSQSDCVSASQTESDSEVSETAQQPTVSAESLSADSAGTTEVTEPLQDGQPALLTGGTLRSYQLDGFRWLKMLYENAVNGILADEMGLGKTVQCIALVSHLIANGIDGPFLVCAPLSTIPNWIEEFKRFAPKVPFVLYHGSKPDRAVLRRGIRRRQPVDFAGVACSFPVVVTSYEIAMNDREFLMNAPWKLLIVDEGHRIKNFNCRLIRELKQYNSAHRLLLTGTPLQNNMAELWSLLNFLIPEIFDSLGSFETWFDVSFLESVDDAHEQLVYEEQRKHTLSMLHQILTPFMLRRLKSDVDFVIPPKRELVVYAPMAAKQSQMYRSILDKTIAQLVGTPVTPQLSPERDANGRPIRKSRRQTLDMKALFEDDDDDDIDDSGSRSSRRKSSRSSATAAGTDAVADDVSDDDDIEKWAESVMQYHKQTADLRKRKDVADKPPATAVINIQLRNSMALLRRCCNHPYLIEYPMDAGQLRVDEQLVASCGKLALLDRMLAQLKRDGHKVLIFSQMTQMMDILEDYCNFRGHSFCRLDGSMAMAVRQDEIGRFNDDEVFLFLLSTRAGGLGINLTQADTVVIYDSDWNPQCDLQAQDRCHRIGQIRPVMVYRLVTANTVDQKIVDRATAKRKLEKLIIHKGKFKSSEDSFTSRPMPISPQELLALLKESDYRDVVKNSENDGVISDADLRQLLDRTDLIDKWTARLAGSAQDSVASEMKNVHGVFHVVTEVWDESVIKSVGNGAQDADSSCDSLGVSKTV